MGDWAEKARIIVNTWFSGLDEGDRANAGEVEEWDSLGYLIAVALREAAAREREAIQSQLRSIRIHMMDGLGTLEDAFRDVEELAGYPKRNRCETCNQETTYQTDNEAARAADAAGADDPPASTTGWDEPGDDWMQRPRTIRQARMGMYLYTGRMISDDEAAELVRRAAATDISQ
jgi:hypothetical protein